MSLKTIILNSFKRSLVQLVERKALLLMIVVIPIVCCGFLIDLMSQGAVENVPIAVVNLDNSSMSRNLERNLSAMQGVKIKMHCASHGEAMMALQRGDVLGFIFIPEKLEEKTLGGKEPMVSFYVNYAYFTPSSSQYKGFKTVSLLANGAIVKTVLDATGLLSPNDVAATLQPILTHVHGINNPWTNYSYYLNMSFLPCLLALIILLTTVTTVCNEFKYNTCGEWLDTAGGSIMVAIATKLIPHSVIFTTMGWVMQLIMFKVNYLPFHCNPWHMILAMPLLVLACQSFALLMICVTPNYRKSATLCTLFGMMSFSFCGFSLPAEAMYPWIESIGYIVPIKHYFLISIDQALNGIDLYYSRMYYAILIGYLLLPLPLLWRIKHECQNPVYVP